MSKYISSLSYSVFYIAIILIITTLSTQCSKDKTGHREEKKLSAFLKGQITVADSIDPSGDYSDFVVNIISQNPAGGVDTLMHTKTIKDGTFSSQVRFYESGLYPIYILRNNNLIANIYVILSPEDTVDINAQVTHALEYTITSKEHDVLKEYQVLNETYETKIRPYILAGVLKDEELDKELEKWQFLFWQIYQSYKSYYASRYAVEKTFLLTSDINKLRQYIYELKQDERFLDIAAGKSQYLIPQFFDIPHYQDFIDSLYNNAHSKREKKNILISNINTLYRHVHVDEALDILDILDETYSDDSNLKNWIEYMSYEMVNMAPGTKISDVFLQTENQEMINFDTLLGHIYLLEITPLANNLYQEQYDRTSIIYQLYRDADLRIYTFAMDENQETLDAFVLERNTPWPVIHVAESMIKDLTKKLNINVYPVRILIDREGRIVRKYSGSAFRDNLIFEDLRTLLIES